jgi:predicted permease
VFGPAERVVGGAPVAVISHGYWIQRFQGSPSVIGKDIVVDGARLSIVGVAPASFTGTIVGASPDVWLPLAMIDVLHPHQKILDDRASNLLLLLGRRPAGTTLAQVRHALGPFIIRTIVDNAPGTVGQEFLDLKPKLYISDGSRGFSRVRATFHAPLITLMIGVALLLCIICANVANLLLARAIARGREMAVRLALGADRRRIARQLLTESAVLAAISAGIGLLVAWWGSRALLALAAGGGHLPIGLSLDWRVLAFTVAVSVGAVGLFGLAPAVRASRVDLASAMRANATSVAGSALGQRGQRAPLGPVLIAGQVALSAVLLVGATMLVRSLRNVQSTNVGLDRNHLVIADLDITSRGYTVGRRDDVLHALRDRLSAIPGVAAVTFSENGIFSGTENGTSIEVPGFVPRSVQDTNVSYDHVGPQYVHAIGGTLLAGRDIESTDEPMLPRAILVNEAFAKFYFPGQPVIGKYIRMNDTAAFRIVGELADTHDHSLEDPPAPRMYVSYIHAPDPKNMGEPGSLRFIVRASGDPAALVQPIRKAIHATDPLLPIDGINPLTMLIQDTIGQERLLTQLATGFGALALLLAAIGLYGVMSYAIGRRTGEIGLRIALGAGSGAVARMVLTDGLRLVGVGLVVGVPLALLSVRALQSQLHGVPTIDPFSISIAVGVLVASAIAAVLIPAVRAARISPIVALKV